MGGGEGAPLKYFSFTFFVCQHGVILLKCSQPTPYKCQTNSSRASWWRAAVLSWPTRSRPTPRRRPLRPQLLQRPSKGIGANQLEVLACNQIKCSTAPRRRLKTRSGSWRSGLLLLRIFAPSFDDVAPP